MEVYYQFVLIITALQIHTRNIPCTAISCIPLIAFKVGLHYWVESKYICFVVCLTIAWAVSRGCRSSQIINCVISLVVMLVAHTFRDVHNIFLYFIIITYINLILHFFGFGNTRQFAYIITIFIILYLFYITLYYIIYYLLSMPTI